ncbi:PH domain-containing protein [Nocardiopsis suaedae]|uniref:PH domain-containing protein n=1 Tax=Nocardiopsis suaedae TaxID=3018444 RepID=A0ABT4TW11_9ACTN|nr:PH domain-containing protein [Nocardiopsis suaedae]MDA2808873.1 PH domain-containing protein [Nocardiopsis suaedae]
MSARGEGEDAVGEQAEEVGPAADTGADTGDGAGSGGEVGDTGDAEPVADLPPDEPWRRLSPLMLVAAPVTYMKNFIVPLALIAFGATQNPWVLGSLFAALVGMVATGVYTWLTFRYQVGADRLEIRKGWIGRSRRTIPLERIRGVHVTTSLVHRVLGLAVVKVEAAAGGGGDEEGKLDAVSAAEAGRLRDDLLHRRAVLRGARAAGEAAGAADGTDEERSAAGDAVGAPEGSGAGVAAAGPEHEYFSMPTRWYSYGMLSVGYLLTPFVALAALFGLLSQGLGDVLEQMGALEAGERALVLYQWAFAEGGVLVLVGLAAGVLLVLVLLMPLFAVVAYAVGHWRFRLVGGDESLVTERGLFTRQSVTLERRRIRGYELADSPLERTRSVVRLRAIMTGLGDASTRAVLLPAGPRDQVGRIVDETLGGYRGGLQRHPRAALRRRFVRALALPLLGAVAAALVGWYWAAAPLLLLALLGIPLAVDRYRSLGHGRDERRISVRSGSLARKQAVVQREAVVGWLWRQSLFQRGAGLAHLTAAVGAGAGGYTAVDAEFAESVSFAAGVTPAMVRPFLESPEEEPQEEESSEGKPRGGKPQTPETPEPPES